MRLFYVPTGNAGGSSFSTGSPTLVTFQCSVLPAAVVEGPDCSPAGALTCVALMTNDGSSCHVLVDRVYIFSGEMSIPGPDISYLPILTPPLRGEDRPYVYR